MPNVESHAPGNFCWVELATSDQGAAKKFYQTLFGWGVDDQPMGPGETYTLFKKNGRDVAAGYSQRPEPKGVPPNWQVYVRTASADEAAAARSSAARSRPPFDVSTPAAWPSCRIRPESSRRVGSAAEHRARRDDEPLLLGRAHGQTPLQDLLQVALRLGHRDDPRYTEWTLGDRSIGGMIEIQKDRGNAAALARLLPGGRLRCVRREGEEPGCYGHGPAGLPGVGRIFSSATRGRPSHHQADGLGH
jgi:predicted enzyme related to lactoylglutathione lyase